MSLKYFNKYKHKITTVKELKKSNFNKKKLKTVLCHGVFDVVHPGHLRHLAHAKTKGDVLIVSLTSDKYIKKGTYRPHVPEKLRALNLSVFELIDFVIIDNNKTANKILKQLKPDYYVKGFEYTSKGLPEATREELKIVKSYGGKMIFSPGDFVYSSSRFLETHLPSLSVEKLNLLMDNNNITFDDLKKVCNKFKKLNVHVIGDTIVDSYTRTAFIGGQIKTPTFSVLKQSVDNYLGGAAIVALHLKEAGANVTFTSVLGNDQLGKFVIKKLKQKKIKIKIITDLSRPTVNKNTIQTGSYKLLKLDTLDNTPISDEILNKIIKNLKSTKSDIVILSDFRHGIFNKKSIPHIIKSIPKNAFKVADSQVASRWGNILEFKNFDLITPNEREARFSLGDQDSSIGSLSESLEKNSKSKNLILKLGDKGIFCKRSRKEKTSSNPSYFSLDSYAGNVVDAVGAGDALLAYSSLGLKNTKSLVIASILGSLAAACECEIDGNIPIGLDKMRDKIDKIQGQISYKDT